MSHEDVVKAYRALQRHGLPVPMSDEAALTFISGYLCLERMRVVERVGNVEQEHRFGLSDQEIDWDHLTTDTTAYVLKTYKKICREIDK